MNDSPSRFTFQEKMLWAQLLGIFVVVAFYARFLLNSPPGHHYFHALIIILLFLFGAARFFVRRRSKSVIEDERDRSIASLGARWSNLTLWLGLVVILVLYWDRGSMRSAAHLIGIIFHLLVLAAILRIVRELIAYRTPA